MTTSDVMTDIDDQLAAFAGDPAAMLTEARAMLASQFAGDMSLLHPAEASRVAKKQPKLGMKAQASLGGGTELTADINVITIDVCGILLHKASFWEEFFEISSYETLQYRIASALNNPRIDGILLDISSPGGMVAGCFDFCDWLKAQQAVKPIHAIARDGAYSAAYAIAASTDKITVTKTGGVGSIGVIMTLADYSKYLENEGIAFIDIFAGEKKNYGSPYAPLSEAARAEFQNDVNALYDVFVNHVAASRNLSADVVRGTQAGCFRADDAVSNGLADQVGNLDQALNTLFAALGG